MGYLAIIGDCLVLSILSLYKQIIFLVYPDERKKDLENVTKSYNLLEEGKNKILSSMRLWKRVESWNVFIKREEEIPFLEEPWYSEQLLLHMEYDQGSLLHVSKVFVRWYSNSF